MMSVTPSIKMETNEDRMIEFGDSIIANLPEGTLIEMRDAGERVVKCNRVLSKIGKNLVGELLKDVETFFEWSHYPDGDVYDQVTHSQYYYHAHPPEERSNEHGHFHTFLRPYGMPNEVKPAPVSDFEAPKNPDDALSHLVAVSMDSAGLPIKMFTTNRWVTGEIWYDASHVKMMLPYFDMDHAQPSCPVNIWLTSILMLFRPQIQALIDERDDVVDAWRTAYPKENVFEDRNLEVTTELMIDVDTQIRLIKKCLNV